MERFDGKWVVIVNYLRYLDWNDHRHVEVNDNILDRCAVVVVLRVDNRLHFVDTSIVVVAAVDVVDWSYLSCDDDLIRVDYWNIVVPAVFVG